MKKIYLCLLCSFLPFILRFCADVDAFDSQIFSETETFYVSDDHRRPFTLLNRDTSLIKRLSISPFYIRDGKTEDNVCDSISFLPELQSVFFDAGNIFGDKTLKALGQNCPRLQFLWSLAENFFTDEGIIAPWLNIVEVYKPLICLV